MSLRDLVVRPRASRGDRPADDRTVILPRAALAYQFVLPRKRPAAPAPDRPRTDKQPARPLTPLPVPRRAEEKPARGAPGRRPLVYWKPVAAAAAVTVLVVAGLTLALKSRARPAPADPDRLAAAEAVPAV